jgi:hypothetical protein
MNEHTDRPPAESPVVSETEPELHASIRMQEVEPIIGKRGKWFYVGWVALWVLLLLSILVIYVVADRFT